jgi:hypothetical protein
MFFRKKEKLVEKHDLIVLLPEGQESGRYTINHQMFLETGSNLEPLFEALQARAGALGKEWFGEVDFHESVESDYVTVDWIIS